MLPEKKHWNSTSKEIEVIWETPPPTKTVFILLIYSSCSRMSSLQFWFPNAHYAAEWTSGHDDYRAPLSLVVLFGCLFPPPILWEHLSEIESEWELLSDTSPPLCESIWVHVEQLWVNKSLDRRKNHWISLVPFGCNWGHLSNWSINN